MKETRMICFRQIPPDFRKNEEVRVIQYEFSGIQSFIWGKMDVSSTRETIRRRSEYIIRATDSMDRWLQEAFSRFSRYRVLSKSSGKLICAVAGRTGDKKICRVSDELQRIIYASTDGALEMYYGFCRARVVSGQDIPAENNAMADLARNTSRNKYHCVNLVGINFDQYRSKAFAPPAPAAEEKGRDLPRANETAAAIKLDLDNLGSFFQKLTAFDERKAASEALAGTLYHVLDSVEGVQPVFAGGDDLFAVCGTDRYLDALPEIYRRIRQEIDSREELALYREHFGLSGGVAYIRNDLGDVPLIYYYEESERSLEQAKGIPGKNAVAIPAPNSILTRGKYTVLTWRQLAALHTVLTRSGADILGGVTEQQRRVLFMNIRELRQRIMDINRNRGRTLLSGEEEDDVSGI